MAWAELTVNTWQQFIDLVEKLDIENNGEGWWCLRGQSKWEWRLVPTLLRHFEGRDISLKSALGIENGIFMRFYREYHLYAKPDGITRSHWNKVAWWMQMQHYGCPTRLLDWTWSPYVALYFSVDKHLDSDGAIWLFAASRLDTLNSERFGKINFDDESSLNIPSTDAICSIIGTQHTERSAPQQGVYTLSPCILNNHEEAIEKLFHENGDEKLCCKIRVPKHLKIELLAKLRTMNITPSSMFPGLDGLGRAANDYVRLRAWRYNSVEDPS